MSASNITIALINNKNDQHWCDSARRIQNALEAASKLLEVGPTVIVWDVEELSSLSNRARGDVFCIICHPTDYALRTLVSQSFNALWVFVSGGYRPADESLFGLGPADVIWFSGIYGRESQFSAWLSHWADLGFEREAFVSTKDALFSGRTGIGVTADRLRKNLLPVIVILEAFQAMMSADSSCHSDGAAPLTPVDQGYRWLVESLTQLWSVDKIFRDLSKDAALLFGAIRNWTQSGQDSQARLSELIKEFLPSYGFHSVYDPELDASVRALISGQGSRAEACETVSKWCQKLSELSTLLEKMPTQDPAFSK